MRVIDLSQLRELARAALNTITAGGLNAEKHAEFVYLPPGEDSPLELVITQEKFFADDAPPGKYRFRVLAPDGAVIEEGEGVKFELRPASEREQAAPSGARAIASATSIMLHHSSAEVERAHRRLREEEDRCDKLKALAAVLEEGLRERDREIAQLKLELEAKGEDEFTEFAEVIGQVVVRALGLDAGAEPAPGTDVAVEVVVTAVRKSADAQRAIRELVGDAPLKRLGIGGAS